MLICAATYMFPEFRTPLPFYGLTVAVVLGFVVPFLHILLQASPIIWILQLLLSNIPRVFICVKRTNQLNFGKYICMVKSNIFIVMLQIASK
jgi:hypothetical protein